MRFQSKVARVVKVYFGLRVVALERLGAGGQKERIILAPDREQRWVFGADIFLERWIEPDVGSVVEEQVELDLVVAGPREQRRVERVGLRCDQRLVRDAMHILKPHRLGLQEVAQCSAIGFGRLLPIFLDWVPTIAQALFIGVAILRDDRRDAIRSSQSETESDRRAVVEDVERVAAQSDSLSEVFDHLREMIESVFELCPVRRVREAKAWEVRRDNVEAICKLWDEVAKHMRGGGKPMKQQKRWMLRVAGFSIED